MLRLISLPSLITYSYERKKKDKTPLFLCSLYITSLALIVSTNAMGFPLLTNGYNQTYEEAYPDLDPVFFTLANVDPASYTGLEPEQEDDQDEQPAYLSRHKRVVGGKSVLWQDYPWIGGLEEIDRDDRKKLDFEYNETVIQIV